MQIQETRLPYSLASSDLIWFLGGMFTCCRLVRTPCIVYIHVEGFERRGYTNTIFSIYTDNMKLQLCLSFRVTCNTFGNILALLNFHQYVYSRNLRCRLSPGRSTHRNPLLHSTLFITYIFLNHLNIQISHIMTPCTCQLIMSRIKRFFVRLDIMFVATDVPSNVNKHELQIQDKWMETLIQNKNPLYTNF